MGSAEKTSALSLADSTRSHLLSTCHCLVVFALLSVRDGCKPLQLSPSASFVNRLGDRVMATQERRQLVLFKTLKCHL